MADEAPLLPLAEMAERLERVLRDSPADETELTWLEVRRGEGSVRGERAEVSARAQRTVTVRVIDRGRMGSHRTGASEPGEIAAAVRQAIAQSRVNQPLRGLPHLPHDAAPIRGPEPDCPEIEALGSGTARDWLEGLARGRQALALQWAAGRVAVFNSRGVRRRTAVTAIALAAVTGRRPGAGRSSDAARRLAELPAGEILRRASERHATGDAGELPAQAVPFVLAPEATIELVELLNRAALTAASYSEGSSLLREHLGVQVFDRAITVRDDGTDPRGLPFPFDLEGTAKVPVDLVHQGTPRTPALDQRQAAQLGLPPTAHAVSGNDARAENLFLVAGEAETPTLLAAADGGIWVGWLDRLQCTDPRRLQFRARAQGLRRIRDGSLAEGLPDALWEDSLLRLFSERPRVGSETSRRLGRDGILGGVTAPGVALAAAGPLRTL
jgi:predicted Zn-dependent protease